MTRAKPVVFVTTGTAGDIHPLMAIGSRLVGRERTCFLVTHSPYRDVARSAGLKFIALDTSEEYQRLLASSAALIGRNHDADARREVAGWYYSAAREQFEFDLVRDLVDGTNGVVVARYLSETAAANAAEASGVAAVWSLFSPHAVRDADGIAELHGSTYLEALNTQRSRVGLTAVPDWLAWVNSRPRLGLWAPWFAPDMADEDGVLVTGFPREAAGRLPHDVWDYLSSGAPPILVTAGSGQMVLGDFHRTAIAGALRSGHRVIVLGATTAAGRWSADRVRQWPRLPLVPLMPHVAAAVHHGGIGTTARCLEAGVPQLVLAEGVDRPDNAARLVRLGVAESLPASLWRIGPVTEALSALCGDGPYRDRAARRAEAMREEDGVETACDRIEELMAA